MSSPQDQPGSEDRQPHGQQGGQPFGQDTYQPYEGQGTGSSSGPDAHRRYGQPYGDQPYGDQPYGQQGPYDQQRPYDQQGPYRGHGPYPPGGGYYAGGPRGEGYLEGARVGFSEAVSQAFRHIFSYRGRASRSAFWWFALAAFIIELALGGVSDRSAVLGGILYFFIGLPTALAHIALAVRRLHDANRSGWWWWIGLVPFVGWIVLLVFYLLPGTPGPNRFDRR